MGEENLKKKTFTGTLWSAIERFGVQVVSFLVTLVMARLLTPDDYGMVGMLTIFIAVSQSLIDAGFSQGLIRKQDVSPRDTSTVFYFNIAASLFLYIVLWIAAPFIADFYDMPQLIVLTRVLSIGIVINSLGMVQRALFTIRLDFKTQAKASFIASALAGATGIWMAYSGFGVWALVGFQLLNFFTVTLFLWIVSPWRPAWLFSLKSFRELFSFGVGIAASSVIDNIYRNLYLLVIGKWFRADTLGYYTRAQQFGEIPMIFSGVIQRVSFPVLCTRKEEDQHLASMMSRFIRISAFLTFPVMFVMAGVARPMIITVLGEKWEFSALLLQILCLGLMWYPISVLNQNILQVKGKSGLFFRLEVIKKVIGVAIICVTLPFGLIPLCLGQMVNWWITIIISGIYTRRVIPLGLWQQIGDVLPVLICSGISGVLSWFITHLFDVYVIGLVAGVAVGVLTYLMFSITVLRKDFRALVSMVRPIK
ncbi:MAG: lipopolysaccharide biosynthesis protein [Muribaculaceae bacterium]|nr:lipopolysaccharide biosynthesis protein [Muribaculaceae bacterium]